MCMRRTVSALRVSARRPMNCPCEQHTKNGTRVAKKKRRKNPIPKRTDRKLYRWFVLSVLIPFWIFPSREHVPRSYCVASRQSRVEHVNRKKR